MVAKNSLKDDTHLVTKPYARIQEKKGKIKAVFGLRYQLDPFVMQRHALTPNDDS